MDWPQLLGMGLVVVGIILYFVDIDVDIDVDIPGISAFDAVGIVAGLCFIIGVIVLLENGIYELGLAVLVISIVTARAVTRYKIMRFPKVPSRAQTLIGQTGRTTTELKPMGVVQLDTEMWTATSDNGQEIGRGKQVMVTDIQGNTLLVFEVNSESNGDLLNGNVDVDCEPSGL